jgi:hypothetical protein
MLKECNIVIIAIGSAQEYNTPRNPFNFYERKDLITNIFYREIISGQLTIIPLKDRANPSNDASWGDYVFEKVKWFTNEKPDVVYEGEETERNTWYDNLDVTIVKVPRGDIPVSATEIREGLCGNGVHSLSVNPMIPAAIRYRIKEMKEVIRNAKQN